MLRVARVGVATLVAALMLGGCADDAPEEPSPSAGQSTSDPAQEPTSEPPSGPSTGEPSSATPSATAPAGLDLTEQTSQVTAPGEDWTRIADVIDSASSVNRSATGEVITLSDRETFSSPATLDEQVGFLERSLPEGAVVERQPDVLLGGEPAYYVQWYEEGDLVVQHDLGLDRGGRTIALNLTLDAGDPAASAALVQAVVDSFTWI